jgi:hypothetical protein
LQRRSDSAQAVILARRARAHALHTEPWSTRVSKSSSPRANTPDSNLPRSSLE